MGSKSLSPKDKQRHGGSGPRQRRKVANPRPGQASRPGRPGSKSSREGRSVPRFSPRLSFSCHRPRETAAGSGSAVRLAVLALPRVERARSCSRAEHPARVRPPRSGRFPNAPSRFRRPRPRRGFPAARLICMARPSPVAIGRSRAPPSPAAPPRRQGSVPRAPGAAGSGRTVKPRRRRQPGRERGALWRRVGGAPGGGRRADPTTAGPKVRRRRAARAPQQASGRRRSGGQRGVGLLGGGRRRRGAGRAERPPGGLAGSASAGQSPCTPSPPGCWTPGPDWGPCFGVGVGSQPNLNG